ncbi:MAG: biopolymer transporter ExbD [Lentisphaerae bacterium]|nr:biopolymer transporter ExbD [Lentisphaerota bacterium]
MPRRTRTMLHAVGEINLVPMLDFAFLLLTVFLITYPLMEQGVHVNLPRGKAAELKPERSRTVSVRLDGALFLDNRAIAESQLVSEMNRLGKTDPAITVFVRADKDLKYSRVMDIMRILHEAGISKMALVSQTE